MPNLLLVAYDEPGVFGGFVEVARLASAEPGVRARAVHDRRYFKRWWWGRRPTLVVATHAIEAFRPVRGRICQGIDYPKHVELGMLERAGVPVPRWTLLDKPRDVGHLGPYVVIKPNVGGRGEGVQIKNAAKLRYKAITSPRTGEPTSLLAQEFIYTGRWPVYYRVLTLFGELLGCMRCEGSRDRQPLESRYGFEGGGGWPIVGGRQSSWSLADDSDVIALGRLAHDAFPDVPVLGTDVVRDAETGRLYVLETNPGGWTWAFSSRSGRSIQAAGGFDLVAQFDAYQVAARVLAERARREAC